LVSEPPGNRAAVAVTRDRTVFFDTPRLDASLVTANGASRRIDGINRIRETNQIVLYTPIFGANTGNRFKSVDLVCTSSDLPIRVNTPIKLTVTEIRPDATDTPIPGDGVIISGGGEAAAFLAENIKLGDTITVRFDVKSPNDLDWTNVAQAVGGGPWLLRQGKPWIDTVAEGFSVSGFEKARHPRTAIGLTRDNKLLLVTVDGRQTISAGISLPDLAALMKRLGAVTAINLDGGGSTSLSVRGILVNAPSGGIEREIASALLVFVPEQAEEEQPLPTITGLPPEIVSGQGMMLQLAWPDRSTSLSVEELEVSATHIKPGVARDSTAPNRPGESLETRLSQEPEALRNVVWGTTGGVGFVNQSGYFTPVKARKGTVNAIYGSRIVSADVKVTPGPPAKLSAELQPDKTDPLRAMIVVTALDMNGNPVSAKEILLNVTGGKPDLERGTTDDKGSFSTGITWDQSALNRAAVATLGDLKAEAGQK
ncbi:MAG: phosphodiester glycosidase family protein, partial [Armatimonadota bacterium]